MVLSRSNPDATDPAGSVQGRAGLNAGRKGWLGREQVITAWPLLRFEEWLGRRHGRARA